jgi:hypothetical protein
MLQDLNTIFSGAVAADGTRTAQAVTATAISTNVLDARQPAGAPTLKDEGVFGQDLWLVVQVIQAFNNLTSLTVTLESDSASTLASAPVVHFSKTIALAALTAGSTAVRVQIPSDLYKRYIGVRYTVTGTAPTTGSVMSFLTLDAQNNILYPSGFTVDV